MKRLPALLLLLLPVLLVIQGCAEKEEVKLLTRTAERLTAEQASAFAVIRPQIGASASSQRADVERYLNAHGQSLNLAAKAWYDLRIAADSGKFEKSTKIAIKNAASTAKAEAELFGKFVQYLEALKPEQQEAVAAWRIAHGQALDALAELTDKLTQY